MCGVREEEEMVEFGVMLCFCYYKLYLLIKCYNGSMYQEIVFCYYMMLLEKSRFKVYIDFFKYLFLGNKRK